MLDTDAPGLTVDVTELISDNEFRMSGIERLPAQKVFNSDCRQF